MAHLHGEKEPTLAVPVANTDRVRGEQIRARYRSATAGLNAALFSGLVWGSAQCC